MVVGEIGRVLALGDVVDMRRRTSDSSLLALSAERRLGEDRITDASPSRRRVPEDVGASLVRSLVGRGPCVEDRASSRGSLEVGDPPGHQSIVSKRTV